MPGKLKKNKRATPGPGGLAIRPSLHITELAIEIENGELSLEDIHVTDGRSQLIECLSMYVV
jgi:hypothetical protein